MRDKKDMIQNPAPKVLLMYQAVNQMINEGTDFSAFKVSDITNRAGIGKGTAYEYFESKEEIIVCSLLYQMQEYMIEINKIIDGEGNFKNKIYRLLDFGSDHFYHGRTFLQILKILLGMIDIPESLRIGLKEPRKVCIWNQFEGSIDRMVQLGIQEGILKEYKPEYYHYIVHTQIISFVMCLHEESMGKPIFASEAEKKEFIYHNLIHQLG